MPQINDIYHLYSVPYTSSAWITRVILDCKYVPIASQHPYKFILNKIKFVDSFKNLLDVLYFNSRRIYFMNSVFFFVVITISLCLFIYALITKQPIWIPTVKYFVFVIICLLFGWIVSIIGKYPFSITENFWNMVLVGYCVVFALEGNFFPHAKS